jgi:hypothetical protein
MPSIRDLNGTPAGNVQLPCGCQLSDSDGGFDLLGCSRELCRVRSQLRLLAFKASTTGWTEGEA